MRLGHARQLFDRIRCTEIRIVRVHACKRGDAEFLLQCSCKRMRVALSDGDDVARGNRVFFEQRGDQLQHRLK